MNLLEHTDWRRNNIDDEEEEDQAGEDEEEKEIQLVFVECFLDASAHAVLL